MNERMSRMLLVTLLAMFGTAAGAAASAQTQVSADWLVDLRTVLTVGGVVLPATWWLSRAFTRISDRLEAGDVRFAALERTLARMEERLAKLPCKSCEECARQRAENERN